MISAHAFGAFSGRANRNVFTLSDFKSSDSTRDQRPRISQDTVSRTSPRMDRQPKCRMIQHTALWVTLGVVSICSMSLLLTSGYYATPTILVALILQIILTLVSMACLMINYALRKKLV
ncbi:hypothetical protein [Chlamydia psittaci]|uniref:hypothetical protein n=1 Tax=Chlamydia psittaci TaxID=83554 RepID=UPI0001F369F5|nr:hypothetical protein [Chlamydia psittaci]AFS19518.1 putative lipoprotein [Chlamydia psittaci 84/55]AFS22709.1 putative lipoprotein [Chlamydia psittaci VS225]AGE75059.1 putative lipoprotein [Chlamydia psittaci Mat116]EPP36918.1 putative lipoprotein [Chlamydia psittaci 84-8471/1]AEG85521.1 putative lipoprotein [Chlamydia psittaci C19/98]